MTKSTVAQAATQAVTFALSALVTLATVASVNGLAAHQFHTAESVALAQGATQVASVQTVLVIGHRTTRA